MGGPRIDQVNIVVDDVGGAAGFLRGLGVRLPKAPPTWEAHHRTLPTETSAHGGHGSDDAAFDIDLDSAAFAQWWGGLGAGFNGVVVSLRVDERSEVDELHAAAPGIGGRSLKAPYDAFWGSRFAVVEGPGPIVVGIMSVPDGEHRHPPPDPASLT